MTAINPPFALQNAGTTHTAENDRMMLAGALAGLRAASSLISRGGVAPLGNQLLVQQQGSPTMAVDVLSGQIYIPGSQGAKQGVYACTNDGTVGLSITTAHPTLPRIDIVVAKVEDQVYSGSNNLWSLAVVTGTAASSPVAPSAPNNSITLAQIAVAAGVTSIVNANITDTRIYVAALGGVISVKDQAERDALAAYENLRVWLRDSKRTDIYDGSAWREKSVDVQVFTAGGTWNKPLGAKSVRIRAKAGGGGSAGVASAASGENTKSGGGGEGSYSESIFDADALASSLTIAIGAAGAAGTSGGGAGGDGGNTTVGTTVVTTNGGKGSTAAASSSAAGFGVAGGNGGAPGTANVLALGGAPGGYAMGSATFATSGAGGGPGGGNAVAVGSVGATSVGTAAAANSGSGAGGAVAASTGTAKAGAAGGAGWCVIETFLQ